MSIELETLDELTAPGVVDFRRGGRGVPLIKNETTGKYERYRRSSSVGKVLDDETGLTDWKIRTTIEGAAQRPDLMAMVSTYDHEANKREIRDIAEQCLVQGKGTQRRETGTAVHAMLDHIDREDGWAPPPQFVDACNAYVATRDAFGLTVLDIECKCVNDTFRLAGTADRRYQTTRNLVAPDGEIVPVGSVLIGDTKTGRTLEYASGVYSTQLAAYADSVRYDPVTDERTPFDPPTYPTWALVVHVGWEDGTCTMHWVDLEAGRLGLRMASMVYEWRRRSDLISPARVPLHAVDGAPDTGAPAERASTGHTEAVPESEPAPERATAADPPTVAVAASPALLADVREWLRERVQAIVADGETATTMLTRVWPMGVPGLKHEGHTEQELDMIALAISSVETQHGMTFPPRDPRLVASDTWANPKEALEPLNRDDLARSIHNHPRRVLLERWSVLGRAKLDPAITDRTALTHALYEFALVNDEWSDDELTEMLDGTLRAIGYDDGVDDLGMVVGSHAPLVMAAAFAITAGTALLMYQEDGRPIVRNMAQQ